MSDSPSYQSRLSAERAIFENQLDVHHLPEIHHYWSNRHLRPRLETFGLSKPDDLFYGALQPLLAQASGPLRFLSLGAGNCDMEIDLANRLRKNARSPFVIDCVDLNPAMLARAQTQSSAAGIEDNFQFVIADLNEWEPLREYDAILANQSLHHVVNLEHLFAGVRRALLPGCPFVISDMIGRNGHQRWPEARAIIDEFWRKLPPSYRFNRVLNRFEERFEDWDCSVEGFEGVRSQDILPLLTSSFHFEFFFAFGNIIDPFVDRSFGHHFDVNKPWARRFIDEVHLRDEAEQRAGKLTPTHMLAIATTEPRGKPPVAFPLAPRDCIRNPNQPPPPEIESGYDCADWAQTLPAELTLLSKALVASHKESEALKQWGLGLNREFEERTAWALDLGRELQLHRDRIAALEQELEERTAWALSLQKQP